jgi:hypothetical protein
MVPMASEPEAQPGEVAPQDPQDSSGDDEARLAAYTQALADAAEAALAGWVERCVTRRAREAGRALDDDLLAEARRAGAAARDEVGARLRRLLEADIDEQRTNPLSVLRTAVRYPTEVLGRARVPPVGRDRDARRLFPEDHYDLAPAAFADIDPALHEPGLHWGAAKAHVHLARRRAEGLR